MGCGSSSAAAPEELKGKKSVEAPIVPVAPPAIRKCRIVSDPENQPTPPGLTRFVCISDTHSRHWYMDYELPPGDVLLHAGDFTNTGTIKEIEEFNEWLGTLPYKHIVVIAGNHELTLDPECYEREWERFHLRKEKFEDASDLLTNCTYLKDSSCTIDGLTIYGSPYTPRFCDWAFNLDRGEQCQKKWAEIPEKVDVLLTHGPPKGYLDVVEGAGNEGCQDLLPVVKERKPLVHVFGHIHEGHGVVQEDDTTFINSCICTLKYKPTNAPVVFDL